MLSGGGGWPFAGREEGTRADETGSHPLGRVVLGRLCKLWPLFSWPGSSGGRTHPPLELVQDSAVIPLAPLEFSGFLKTRWPGRREEGGRSRSPEECESLPKPEQPVRAESARGGRTLPAFLGPWSEGKFPSLVQHCSSGKCLLLSGLLQSWFFQVI